MRVRLNRWVAEEFRLLDMPDWPVPELDSVVGPQTPRAIGSGLTPNWPHTVRPQLSPNAVVNWWSNPAMEPRETPLDPERQTVEGQEL